MVPSYGLGYEYQPQSYKKVTWRKHTSRRPNFCLDSVSVQLCHACEIVGSFHSTSVEILSARST